MILSPFLCVYMGTQANVCKTTGRVVGGICAVIFKSLYKNKRENVWVPGWVGEIMACPGVFGTIKNTEEYVLQDGCLFGTHTGREILYG